MIYHNMIRCILLFWYHTFPHKSYTRRSFKQYDVAWQRCGYSLFINHYTLIKSHINKLNQITLVWFLELISVHITITRTNVKLTQATVFIKNTSTAICQKMFFSIEKRFFETRYVGKISDRRACRSNSSKLQTQ